MRALTDRNYDFRFDFGLLLLCRCSVHTCHDIGNVRHDNNQKTVDYLFLAPNVVWWFVSGCVLATNNFGRVYPRNQVPIGKYAELSDTQKLYASYCGNGSIATALQIIYFVLSWRARERANEQTRIARI